MILYFDSMFRVIFHKLVRELSFVSKHFQLFRLVNQLMKQNGRLNWVNHIFYYNTILFELFGLIFKEPLCFLTFSKLFSSGTASQPIWFKSTLKDGLWFWSCFCEDWLNIIILPSLKPLFELIFFSKWLKGNEIRLILKKKKYVIAQTVIT